MPSEVCTSNCTVEGTVGRPRTFHAEEHRELLGFVIFP